MWSYNAKEGYEGRLLDCIHMVKTSNIVNIDYNTNLEICFLCNFIDNLKLEMAYVPCAEI